MEDNMENKQAKQPKAAKSAEAVILESSQRELRIVSVTTRTSKDDTGKDSEYYMFSAIDLVSGRKISFSISKLKAVKYGWLSGVTNIDGKDVQVKGSMDNILTSGMGEVYVTVHLTEVPEVGIYGYKDRAGLIHEYRNGTVVFDQFDGYISKEAIREYESVATSKASTQVLEERVRSLFAAMTGHEFRPGNPDDVPMYLNLVASLK